ncbi:MULTISPECIES: cyclic nucleotide-binding domain-containing protein [unclassified Okeania]|uniref:cyclic nucleotide-binding domain-containing protein n=1 Tax=unclassified Okeania TaxID=2634635 RepID=UPI0013BAB55F|nr:MULTISPECIES: cyclic nucleotide-binding domain-containing protein [unclassified Okeania]NES79453.1 mechanosensitive ion channel [Okeania sp. SIO1H4]NET23292.1 mechanosensitive ion channel [Okeania sp. SIO1H5]NET96753.1 mechanosensitive ion channel [Okeania sp. SIO1H2]
MNWIFLQGKEWFQNLSRSLTTPLFYIGDNHLSISAIVRLILLGVAVLIIARAIGEGIKRLLLTRMGLDRGNREAIASVIIYIIAILGILIVLQRAGIDLRTITVLAGVLGIGLGFGLQNLASNFISGLTLLFEQPIKVGDFIEVDNLLGTVENISIRSTIVRTLDGIFVIVPNIKFVENNIINWSYKDPKSRLRMPVGVAYGSDPLLVTEALLAAARAETSVLNRPSPKVWFKGFGDSSLDFELLVWIDHPQDSDIIQSSLNFLIEHELTQQDIVIPFPQRDLWLKNPQDLSTLFNSSIFTKNSENKVFSQNGVSSEQKHSSFQQTKKSALKSPNNWTLRDLLRRVTYFESLTDLKLRKLIEYGYRQLFPQGQIIFRENDVGDSFYIILSGAIEVISEKTGKYIATLHEGEFFGEMSLLLGSPRTATVKTIEDSILFVIEKHDLQRLLEESPSLATDISRKLCERRQALQELGLLDRSSSENTPFTRIRNRIQTLFGI